MRSVKETCKPRDELLKGSFNPEVFTASLRPVLEFYRTGKRMIDSIYTNAESFFSEATFPTDGLRSTLSEVFGRLAGDHSVPSIHRLETAFGGGKTHTLIACTHIAFKGRELLSVTQPFIDPELLPEPSSISVVGIAGDDIPVHRPKGDTLVPYTLWGEMAYQIGGAELYREVEDEASSHAAPGHTYFDRVFQGRRVIVMLDELAQYAARLEAAQPDGAAQLAAFLMSLHGYARNQGGLAILLTLASAADAFSKQTERLASLISQVRGEEIGEDEAIAIGEQAVKGVASVVARDSVQITPVQASEISSVLAKRLFAEVDKVEAAITADDYMSMYRRNSQMLPDQAISEDFKERMISNYPFHPTLVDFLNHRLAEAENFQGTRGVLRVLALAVRNLWQSSTDFPMIHACHLDLRSERVVNEIFGRTGSSDLLPALNADVGGVDTGSLEGGRSVAQLADRRNPHPEKLPFYEYTWKTVFLHSLVGRTEGIGSRLFGISEADCLFSVAFPGLSPSQVRTALEEIPESGLYLRYDHGKYFAHDEPTINSVLARIRNSIKREELDRLLEATARKIITEKAGSFHVDHDVTHPEHISDGRNRPVLGMISLTAGEVSVQEMFTKKGENLPREQQNTVLLLVPQTVEALLPGSSQKSLPNMNNAQQEIRQRIDGIARQVQAMRVLKERPLDYGVLPKALNDEEFRTRQKEREQALITAVSGVYTYLYYSSAHDGSIRMKEIKTAGGESGTPFVQLIRQTLMEAGELLTEEQLDHATLKNLASKFFANVATLSLTDMRKNFLRLRSWPLLEDMNLLERLVRSGAEKSAWMVYRMGDADNVRPNELYDKDNVVPLSVDLSEEGYGIITPQGAAQRGWLELQNVDMIKIRSDVTSIIADAGNITVQTVREKVGEKYGTIPDADLDDVIVDVIKVGKAVVYTGDEAVPTKDKTVEGAGATLYRPEGGHVLLSRSKASEAGVIEVEKDTFVLDGKAGLEQLFPQLRRIGSLYTRGATSHIDFLEFVDLELPGGGKLRVELTDAPPESMKALGELFEVLDAVATSSDTTECSIEIRNLDDNCIFVKALKEKE